MATPVPHHLATGIHPGAFVQPTAPDTSDVQDGVFWLDTSAGPPYVLKRWDQSASTWRTVQMDQTGYPLPGGHRLDVVVGSARSVSDGPGDHFELIDPPPPTSEWGIAHMDLSLAPPFAGPIDVAWQLHVSNWAYTAAENTADQDSVLVLRLRRDGPSGEELLAYTTPPIGPATAEHDWVASFHDAAPTSGHYRLTVAMDPRPSNTHGMFFRASFFQLTESAEPTIRLLHAGGAVCCEYNGQTGRVYAGGQAVLQTPFPTLLATPSAVLGRDAVTGLPMWSDIAPPPKPPPPVSKTYSEPDQTATGTTDYPSPAPPPPLNPERACGAAELMTSSLVNIYNACIYLINSKKNDIIRALTTRLKRDMLYWLMDILATSELGAPEIGAVWDIMWVFADTFEVIIFTATKLPYIASDSSIYAVIRCCAWQALWLRGGDYLLEADASDGIGTRDHWTTFMNGDWSFFAGSTILTISSNNLPWQLNMLNGLLHSMHDAAWANTAWNGAQKPSLDCRGCSGYPP